MAASRNHLRARLSARRAGASPGTRRGAPLVVGDAAAAERVAALAREPFPRAAADLEHALRRLLEEPEVFLVEFRELEGVALGPREGVVGEGARMLRDKIVEDDLEALVLGAHEGLVLEVARDLRQEGRVGLGLALLGLHRC